MWIKVTRAEPQALEKRGQPADIVVAKPAEGKGVIDAMEDAAGRAVLVGRSVFVQF